MKFVSALILLVVVDVSAVVKSPVELLIKSLNLKEVSTDYVIVNMWSPFCEPCGQEVSELNSVFKEKNLTIIGLPIDGRNKAASEFIAHFKPLYEQRNVNSETRHRLMTIGSIPYTILLNKKRKLVQEWTGKITANNLMSAISKNEKE